MTSLYISIAGGVTYILADHFDVLPSLAELARLAFAVGLLAYLIK
jgi:hypothetical protein